MAGSPDRILEQLQEAGRLELGDFMTFEVRPDAEHPDIQSEGMQYEGMRFRAECRLAGKIYDIPSSGTSRRRISSKTSRRRSTVPTPNPSKSRSRVAR